MNERKPTDIQLDISYPGWEGLCSTQPKPAAPVESWYTRFDRQSFGGWLPGGADNPLTRFLRG